MPSARYLVAHKPQRVGAVDISNDPRDFFVVSFLGCVDEFLVAFQKAQSTVR
jgi:hypothetical protein